MPQPLKDIRIELLPVKDTKVKSDAKFSHSIERVQVRGSIKRWIKKECPDPSLARSELLAQELFRLIIPHQPETRLLVDPVTNVHYILSEEVTGYKPLPVNQASNFTTGVYTGLGQATLMAVFLQESDFKNGNVGLDNQNRVIKIDGDWCFTEHLIGNKTFELTTDTIAALPYPQDFWAYNWLDLIMEERKNPYSFIVEPELKTAPKFRNEVNQAMLKICLMPDEFIEAFVNSFIPAGADWYINTLKERRNLLIVAAIKDPSFNAYMLTDAASRDKLELLDSMQTFVANGEDYPMIPTSIQQDSIGSKIEGTFTNLKTLAILYESASKLIDAIEGARVNNEDIILMNYVNEMRKKLKQNPDKEGLVALTQELSKTFESVSSPQVRIVQTTIASYRSSTHCWTIGKKDKADAIEFALVNMPLDKRKEVISGSRNLVQIELATRRWGSGEKIKIDDKGEIDIKKSAKTFKDLKKRFGEVHVDKSKNESLDEPSKKLTNQ